LKKTFARLLCFSILLAAAGANAGPEEDRLKLIQHFKIAFPDIKPNDYVYGSLVFDPDAKARFDIAKQTAPYAAELGKGEQLWRTPLKSGKTYANCLPNGGKNIAGNYPLFDDSQAKVMTLEDAINACRVSNGEAAYGHAEPETMGLLTAYLRTLSEGMQINIKVDGARARLAYEDGKQTFYRRSGQLNYSCAHCHVDHVGNRIRTAVLSPAIGQAAHWPMFRNGTPLLTLQKQYEICHRNMRQVPDMPGSLRYNNLEYFHTYISNGLPLRSSAFQQ